jgi:hypothetical protein
MKNAPNLWCFLLNSSSNSVNAAACCALLKKTDEQGQHVMKLLNGSINNYSAVFAAFFAAKISKKTPTNKGSTF